MLRALGIYLTKSPKNAIWVALLCGFLSVFSIPVAWIGLVIIGLLTLHDGHKSGLLVLAAFALPSFIFGFFVDFSFFMDLAVYRGLAVWLLAWILSQTCSWSSLLRGGVLAGMVGVAIFYVFIDDVPAWWAKLFNLLLANTTLLSAVWETPEAAQLYLKHVAEFATGLSALWFLTFDLLMLLMARGWQALLYNPGGLQKELMVIRMSRLDSIVLLLCLIAAWLGLPIARDFLPLVLLPFFVAGLSLVHVKTGSRKEIKTSLRVVFYMLLIFFFSYVALILACVGVIDSWYDFRARGFVPGAKSK